MKTPNDEHFMQLALAQAGKGIGRTSPNPAVGAILVVEGKVIAQGHHRGAGRAHAEVECLRAARDRITRDAILYVTLEPCSTRGRTPPCTDAIIAAGVKQVVVGAIDVNPAHSGRGIDVLRAAGVKVSTGVLAAACTALNEHFNHWIRTGRPFVIAKCGMTPDGHLTRLPSESQWITSAAARRHAHRFRAQVDAILVGAETVRADNPHLTVHGVRAARQPWRVVLSKSGCLPATAHLFEDAHKERTLVFREESLASVLDQLGAREVTSVLIEGGGAVLGQALDQRLIDRVQIYLGSMLTGGSVCAFAGHGAGSTEGATRLHEIVYEKVGAEIFLTGKTAAGPVISE
ncbi:MAG: bifunctional diaminohydroxyphosphoribosylaminopyrimidine deaminase/5-amino-6-(5-phosphoribosylamino)uracil reductase RibD [Chthoniobacterales bacterium]